MFVRSLGPNREAQLNKKERRIMKKLIAIAAMAMVVGATVGRAQVTTTVTKVVGPSILVGPLSVDMKVKLTAATKPTAPTVTGLEWARVQVPGTPTNVGDVFGTAILDVTGVSTSSVTAGGTDTVTITTFTALSSNAWVVTDTPIDLGKGKFAEAGGAVTTNLVFGSSNTAWYVTGTVKDPKGGKTVSTNVSAKVVGVWQEGVSAFSASISTAKK